MIIQEPATKIVELFKSGFMEERKNRYTYSPFFVHVPSWDIFILTNYSFPNSLIAFFGAISSYQKTS